MVVEDLISTGKSSLLVVEVLRHAGLEVLGMTSIFSYQFEEAESDFEKANIKHQSLTDFGTLIAISVEKGIVHSNDEAMLLHWRKDPANWNGVEPDYNS